MTMALLLAVPASLLGGAVAASPEPDSGFYVVAFERRIDDAGRAGLVRTGADIIGYEPDDSYIVWANNDEAAAAGALGAVDAVTPVPLDRKLAVESGARGSIAVDVVTYGPSSATIARSLDALGDVGRIARLDAHGTLATVTMTIAGERLSDLAARPDVLFIEPAITRLHAEDEKTTQLIAGNIGDDKYSVPGYLEWLDKLKLSGKGIKAAIVDTGINESHPDLAGRIAKTVDYGDGPVQETPYDTGGHGTHVAGIVAGSPSGSGPIYEDPDGFLYGMGVAPQAELINLNLLSFFGPSTGEPDNVPRFVGVTKDAYTAGARMWNASWHTGQGNRAGYLASVRIFDELARDALPKTPKSEEFLFVFSAGNAGASGPTVPKEAKNLIAVGATNSGRGAHYPLTTDPEAIASFSSIGPTKDGRIFPTVSAPGANVISARAIEGTASLLCATPIDGFVYYCSISGTSMAAPHVTGSAALIHQWWKRSHGALPSPAMVKALLVNSADDVGPPDIPNNFEGWGRVDLGSLFTGRGAPFAVDQSTRFTAPDQRRTYIVAADGKNPLKITLSWSDAPASVGAEKVLVNDLDLVVEPVRFSCSGWKVVGDDIYRGNVFTKGMSKTGGKPDRLNNLENMFLSKAAGYYRITVRASNLPGDGIPNNSDHTDQDFALVTRGGHQISLHCDPGPVVTGAR